jgi:hypothetical protein
MIHIPVSAGYNISSITTKDDTAGNRGTENGELSAKSIEGPSLSLEGVNDVKGCD